MVRPNNTESAARQPVCECDDFQCDEPLGIDWDQYKDRSHAAILISKVHDRRKYNVTKVCETYYVTLGRAPKFEPNSNNR